MRKTFGSIALVIIFAFCSFHIANADELSELKGQMLKIQGENAKLQEQLDNQKELMEQLLYKVTSMEMKDEIISNDVEQLKAKEIPETEYMGEDFFELNEQPYGPKLGIKGFADISFKTEDEVSDDEQNYNTFTLGSLDLFINSELSDRISFLSEINFEHNDENDLDIEVERLQMTYAINELINVKFGRMHTALGFWNTEYHHSTWLHTTISRPLIQQWEDVGGIIPNHFVGLYIYGRKYFDLFNFEYDLGVANGRGKTETKIQNVQDRNDSKAFSARVQFSPSFLPELKMGVSAYIDKIPADTSNDARNGEIDELILGGHIAYFKNNLELLAEIIHINHDDDVSNKDFDTFGLYLQGAYQFNKWKPYYRFDFLNFDDEDPFYTHDDTDFIEHTLGVRWDPITWNSIKLEYKFSNQNGGNDINSVTVQSAFTF